MGALMAWARLVTEEPEELTYKGPWGQNEAVTVGGDQGVSVTCPRCGIPNMLDRDCSAAAA
jgi:hypothetical protein